MSNPLNNKPNQSNPINDMLDFLNNGGSKEQIFNQLLGNNPQFNAMKQLSNPREMVMQLAKKQGIDIKQVEELARRLGAK